MKTTYQQAIVQQFRLIWPTHDDPFSHVLFRLDVQHAELDSLCPRAGLYESLGSQLQSVRLSHVEGKDAPLRTRGTFRLCSAPHLAWTCIQRVRGGALARERIDERRSPRRRLSTKLDDRARGLDALFLRDGIRIPDPVAHALPGCVVLAEERVCVVGHFRRERGDLGVGR